MCSETDYEWDEEKRLINQRKHSVDFKIIVGFDWKTAQIEEDNRFNYNEVRYIATGLIELTVYRLSFTYRGDKIRLINFRKAKKFEVKNYVRYIKN